MDSQLWIGFQTANMIYFNQSITTLWQVNLSWIFLGKRYELMKCLYKSVKNQLSDDKLLIVP